jgi:hypothetical protein
MKVYSCVKFYASTFKDEPEPRWPVDYDFQEEMSQRDSTITAPVSVRDCNRNGSGLQSAHFWDRIIGLYPSPQDRIICL